MATATDQTWRDLLSTALRVVDSLPGAGSGSLVLRGGIEALATYSEPDLVADLALTESGAFMWRAWSKGSRGPSRAPDDAAKVSV